MRSLFFPCRNQVRGREEFFFFFMYALLLCGEDLKGILPLAKRWTAGEK